MIQIRPLCVNCKSKPRAYAYKKGSKIYWRKLCDTCNRKKSKCELCGFKAQNRLQLDVFFVDGNMRNTNNVNLKTVCANCQRLTSVKRLGWKIGDLVADE